MPRVKPLDMPRFGSQLSSSRRTDPGSVQSQSSSLTRNSKGGNNKQSKDGVAEPERHPLKVKLPKLSRRRVDEEVKKGKTTSKKLIRKQQPTQKKSAKCQEKQIHFDFEAPSALLEGDVFFFSESANSQNTNDKEKAKHSVLRTISKMLEENRLIRQRLSALSEAV